MVETIGYHSNKSAKGKIKMIQKCTNVLFQNVMFITTMQI